MLKESCEHIPIGMAGFRTEEIRFDVIMKTVRSMISSLPACDQMAITNSWDRVRERMENVAKGKVQYSKLDLSEFPKLNVEELPPLLDDINEPLDSMRITGKLCDETIEAGRAEEVSEGMDVVLYGKKRQ